MSDTLPQIRTFLEQTGRPFDVLPCDPELADTAMFCEHYGVALAKRESSGIAEVAS